MTAATPVLELRGIGRTFIQGERRLAVLREATFGVSAGEIVAVVGPSGSGKSTLLHIAGLLERPDAGDVVIAGQVCGGLSDAERTRLRRAALGFVYQFHHLLPEFSALENVILPQMIAGAGRARARERARALLDRFGLGERLNHRPARLSGGEQQRTAIARAMANEPKLLLADEPTGNLDQRTADAVFGELVGEARSRYLAAVIVTHNERLAQAADRVVTLQDGVLVAH
ncbi:MAG: ABC transporter ATP-binding protein [Alphaproteobacteria bacterium]|nr:ABC transporter ATP-binding protein [Alphaproteobacteria bacterium]